MKLTDKLSFDHEDRERIYEYVESHGTVERDSLNRALNLDPRAVRHHVAILKRDGYLTDDDGELKVAFEDETAAEEHTSEDIDFVIRQARQEDLAGLVGAIRAVASSGDYIVAESVADVLDHEEVLLRHNELESRMFFVATVGDDVVGWVHIRAPELEKLSHTAELTVGVLGEYRRHDIGSHLLERGVGWAASNGYEKIYNSVPATNEAAITFLEGHGWETEAVRENHYRIDDDYVDEVMMATTV
ncbi:GNAT family N-acetyltransferase [Haloarchaeobius litoreus]|uniref:GNAT family N-acetyltransferase n=1 Tax=Haloarchaeobius litoreus TaxID=755306 RepID=A0ABD6DKQ0_9EURY|nr:GNAT family N-acetyltransferase [Haloarchaeobius litoreus]